MTNLSNKSDRQILEMMWDKIEDNQKIIKGLQRKARFATFFSLLKWFIYIGIAIGIYAYFEPLVSSVTDTYETIKESTGILQDIKTEMPNFDNPFSN